MGQKQDAGASQCVRHVHGFVPSRAQGRRLHFGEVRGKGGMFEEPMFLCMVGGQQEKQFPFIHIIFRMTRVCSGAFEKSGR